MAATAQPVRLGNSGGEEAPLEAGHLRGTGGVVYFVFDAELMSQLTGCQLPAANEPGHCYELDPARMTWALDGDKLALTDGRGGSSIGFAIEPWQKIG